MKDKNMTETTDKIIKGTDFKKYWYKDIREIETIKEMLEQSADEFSANPAFWVKYRQGAPYNAIDYKVLLHDVQAFGSAMRDRGMTDMKIAVMGEGSYEWIVSYLAVICGLGVVVPVDRELESESIDNVLRAAGCDTMICSYNDCHKLSDISSINNLVVTEFYGDRNKIDEPPAAPVRDMSPFEQDGRDVYSWRALLREGDELLEAGYKEYTDLDIDPDALAVILFTSGTTGNPKGVMLTNRNITANIMDVCRIAHIHTWDKTLSFLPIHHTYECTLGMLLVLYRGASTAFCEGLKYIMKNMKEAQNTVIIVVPRVLEMIHGRIMKTVKKAGKEKTIKRAMRMSHMMGKANINISRKMFQEIIDNLGGKLRLVITGAAALSPELYRDFEDFGITVLQGYGMTECTPLIAGTPESARGQRYDKAGSVGTVVNSGEIKILEPDEHGIGEILFKGPNVMKGYYNMPEETAEALSDGWLYTGDLGYVDKDGWLYLTGRKKNIIVTDAGENIYPEEVEDHLKDSPYIADCMVYAAGEHEDQVGVQVWPDMEYIRESYGEIPESHEIESIIKAEIKDLNQGLAPFKRIRKLYVRKEDFIRTTTEKIRRQDNTISHEDDYGLN